MVDGVSGSWEETSLSDDTAREATSDEVKNLRCETSELKEALAETLLENRLLKKSMHDTGGERK